MLSDKFYHSVSIDFPPHKSLCEWCGKPATQQLTAIGGKNHNEGGLFCLECGEEFFRIVSNFSNDIHLSSKEKAPVDHAAYKEPFESEYDADILPIPLD